MKISEITETLSAKVYAGQGLPDIDICSACASDMMSDVLAFFKDPASLLISGLNNPQVIRTADMLDIKCVALVRGKVPNPVMIQIAEDRGITLLGSDLKLYEASGLLYAKGLMGGSGAE